MADTCFAGINFASADTEFRTDFGLHHAVHVAVQNGEFQRGEPQRSYKFIVLAVIGLFLLAVDGIHRKSLIIREVYGFNDSPAPVRPVAKKADKAVYFTVAGKFDRDFFSLAVFAVNLVYFMTDILVEKADSSLRYVVAVRHGIVYLVYIPSARRNHGLNKVVYLRI